MSEPESLNAMLCDGSRLHAFLQSHFLRWIECLSSLNELPRAIDALNILLSMLNKRQAANSPGFTDQNTAIQANCTLSGCTQDQAASHLLHMVKDGHAFLVRHFPMIARWPLQVYRSAIIFTPESNLIRQIYKAQVPRWLHCIDVGAEADWSTSYQELKCHSGLVTSVAFSAPGQLLVSGSWDKSVNIWSTGNTSVQRSSSHETEWTAKIRSLGNISIQQTLIGHSDAVTSVAVSPDSRLIVSGSRDSDVRLWSLSSNKAQMILRGHTNTVNSVTFSPNGHFLASGSSDKTIKTWSVQNGECQKTLRGHSGIVTSVTFSPDGHNIASGSSDKTVKIWSIETGEPQQSLIHHSGPVTSVAFSANGQLIASSSWDKSVKLWSTETRQIKHTLSGHSSIVASIAFSADSGLITSGSWDATIKVWSTKTGKVQQAFMDHGNAITSLSFSPNGHTIASGNSNATVKVWPTKPESAQELVRGELCGITALAFSADHSLLSSGGRDGTIKVWSVVSGEIQQVISDSEAITLLAFSNDKRFVASNGQDETVKVWSVKTGIIQQTFTGHSLEITSVVFSSDSRSIVSGSRDKTVKVWSLETGDARCTFAGHSDDIVSVAFSADDRLVASGSRDKTVMIWSVPPTGRRSSSFKSKVASILPHRQLQRTILCSETISCLRFTMDGSHVITNSEVLSITKNQSSGELVSQCDRTDQLVFSNGWIERGSQRLLYVPLDVYRFLASGDMIALGCHNGRVLWFKVDGNEID